MERGTKEHNRDDVMAHVQADDAAIREADTEKLRVAELQVDVDNQRMIAELEKRQAEEAHVKELEMRLRIAELEKQQAAAEAHMEAERRVAELEKQQAAAEARMEAERRVAELEKLQAEARVKELEMYLRQQTQKRISSACCAVS
jgi:hypothetical protein